MQCDTVAKERGVEVWMASIHDDARGGAFPAARHQTTSKSKSIQK
jgi:hypothetical protein